MLIVPALLVVGASPLAFMPSSSFATSHAPLTVTVTTVPASGGTVAPGATISYTLHVEADEPLPAGATVVDDLADLLDNASVITPRSDLAEDGLRLSTKDEELTWTLPALAEPDGSSAVATTSFQVAVAADAPDGAELKTAATAPEGESCDDDEPCATSHTVQAEPEESPGPDDPTPSDPATSTQPTPSSTPSQTGTPTSSAPKPAGRETDAPPARPNAAAAVPCDDPQNAPVIAGGFEIDGNLCTNKEANSDWDVAGTQPVATDPIGNADTSAFTQGVSENDGPNWSVTQSTDPNGVPSGQARADVRNAYGFTRVAGADVFAYLGFELRGGTGTTSVHIELNQKPNDDPSCPKGTRGVPSPCRTSGDVLLAFDKDGSNPITLAQAWIWNGSAWVSQPVAGVAVGRANDGAVKTLDGRTLGAGEFGEVGVNLASLFGPGNCSGNFGTLNLRTSASTTLTSSLIDWVQPIRVGVPSTCPTVVLQKHWVNGFNGDTARLSINGATTAPGFATSTANGSPDFTDTAHRATTAVEPGSQVNLAETLGGANGGTYASTIGCDNNLLTPPLGGTSGSFTMPENLGAGAIVTCTFTNTRDQARVVLQKSWVNAATGDRANLSIAGGTPDPSRTATSTVTTATGGTFTDTVNQAAVAVGTGDTVTVTESLPAGNIGSYASALVCDNGVVPNAGGSFTVTAALVNKTVTCTFTNTRRQATVVLQKAWVNGATNDVANLSITGGVTDPATATSTVTAASGGTFTDTAHQASTAVRTGDRVTVAEVLPAGNTGSYASALACDNGVTPDAGGSFTSTAALANKTVTCTFTNTRHQATLVLQKRWINAATGDVSNLTITGGLTSPATAISTANGQPDFTDTVHQASTAVRTGNRVTVAEALPAGNKGSYASALACDNNVTPDAGGSFTITAALANKTVTCTFANARETATVVLQKRWINAVTGDVANLTITGGVTSPVTATSTANGQPDFTDTANRATTPVRTGDRVTVAESLPGGNLGSYADALSCDNGVVPDADGSFTVTAAMVASGVTCTFTNTRQTATVVLQKHWNNGSLNDQADLSIAGGDPDPAAATSTVTDATGPTFTDTANQASAAVRTGDTVTVTETLPGNTGSYDTTLVCDNGAVPDAEGTFRVTAAMVASGVTCTFTNTRQTATVVLQKHWNNGSLNDQADLSIAGGDPNPATATSTVTDATGPTFTDTVNQASAAVQTGDEVTVTEDLAGNTGSYDTTLTCDNNVVPDADGSFTITAALAKTTVTCTFTNTRQTATVVLQKHWDNGALNDQAILTIAGGVDPATATSTVTTATGPTFTDEVNRASTAVRTGDQVTVTESLPGGNTGSYDTTLTCDNNVVPDADGSFTITAALAKTTVTCTFTNTRQTATVVLQKHWDNGALNDQAILTIAGGVDPATATSTVTTATGPTFTDEVNRASTAVRTGDQVTVTESLPGGNTGSYDTTLVCDNGAVPDADGTFTVTAAMVASGVTCTFTNTRTSAELVLQKTWVDGAADDTADLSIDGATDGAGFATSTATGAAGSETDTVNRATATIRTGDQVTVSEDLPAGNTGGYDTTVACDNGALATQHGTSGSFRVTAAMVASGVTCTLTNTLIEVAGEQAGSHPHSQQGSQPAVPANPPASVPTTVDSGLADTQHATGAGHEAWPWLLLVAGGLLGALSLVGARRRDPE